MKLPHPFIGPTFEKTTALDRLPHACVYSPTKSRAVPKRQVMVKKDGIRARFVAALWCFVYKKKLKVVFDTCFFDNVTR